MLVPPARIGKFAGQTNGKPASTGRKPMTMMPAAKKKAGRRKMAATKMPPMPPAGLINR